MQQLGGMPIPLALPVASPPLAKGAATQGNLAPLTDPRRVRTARGCKFWPPLVRPRASEARQVPGMRCAAVLFVVVAVVSAGGQARSHGGGLNAEGCHTKRATGEYHCHRAPRAAQPTSPVQRLAPTPGSSGKRSCGGKTTCGQMAS